MKTWKKRGMEDWKRCILNRNKLVDNTKLLSSLQMLYLGATNELYIHSEGRSLVDNAFGFALDLQLISKLVPEDVRC